MTIGSRDCYKVFTPRHVPVGAGTGYEIHEFLAQEALMLDQRQFADWATLLARDLTYRCPSWLFSPEFGKESETKEITHEYDRDFVARYAQRPELTAPDSAKCVRRLITNVLVSSGGAAKEYSVKSYVLVAAASANSVEQPLITFERRDIIRRCSYTFQIARREVALSRINAEMLRTVRVL
jgi:3-phenylpropionate/cinnamic acid dioxygenase small subunit